MMQSQFAAHLANITGCLHEVLKLTDDPIERTKALWVAQSRMAALQADVFFDEIRLLPSGQGDLYERAYTVVKAQIELFLSENHALGIVGADLDFITENLVGGSFFDRLNALTAAVPPEGRA